MNSFKWFAALASAVILAFGISAGQAQDKKAKSNLSKEDTQAMEKLAQGDMAEVEAGKVAAQKASSAEVKKFGQHMVDEHTKMLEEGKKLAQAKGVKAPASPDKKHQDALKKLQGLSGDEFDRRFMEQMVNDHQEALKLAEKTAKEAKDSDLKAHAQKGAPKIKEHLAQATKLRDSLAASSGASKRAEPSN